MKHVTISLSILMFSLLGKGAWADQSTVTNLGTAISICAGTVADASSGEYSNYPSDGMDSILDQVATAIEQARPTANSSDAAAVMDKLLNRIAKILNDDATNPSDNYSIPTVVSLFQDMQTKLTNAQALEEAVLH